MSGPGPTPRLTRREAIVSAAAAAGALAGRDASPLAGRAVALRASAPSTSTPAAGRLKQSACRWPYRQIPLPEFCRALRGLGIAGIDLLFAAEWPVARDAGLVCSMGYPADRRDFISTGFNDRANHAMLLTELERTIPVAAQQGVPNVIAMFGNRRGKSDAEAIDACVAGLTRIAPLAETHGVTVCVELLNSKVDHADYQGDRTAFGVAVVKAVNSPRVKLLYDIYHMQIMEGDIIRTIRDHARWIAHFHTGGVPGRHELDDSQELNWHAIAAAIADLSFTGYVAHEFVPVREPLRSLREAVETCTV